MQGAVDHAFKSTGDSPSGRVRLASSKGKTVLKIIVLASALLIPTSVAQAQDAPPVQMQAPAARPVARKPAPSRAVAPAPKSADAVEISQIDGIRQVNPATRDQGDAFGFRSHMRTDNPGKGVPVGNGDLAVTQFRSLFDHFFGMRGSAKETEVAGDL